MIDYEIQQGWPPNIADIRAVLPVSENNIFAYGRVIYSPGGVEISPSLIAHEQVHFRQQAEFECSWWQKLNRVEAWWKKFLASPEFRLEVELEAHREEHRVFCQYTKDRNMRAQHLSLLAKRLAAPMYGGVITVGEARKAIQ